MSDNDKDVAWLISWEHLSNVNLGYDEHPLLVQKYFNQSKY